MTKISPKTSTEIENMRHSGRILGQVLSELERAAQPGVSLRELSDLSGRLVAEAGGEAAFLGHEGYKYPLCASVNDVIVHGIPTDYRLQDGDIVGLDFGVRYHGMVTDSAVTVAVGKIKPAAQQLLDATQAALEAGIGQACNGNRVGDISAAVERVLRQHKLGIIKELVGHGVGRELWEEPQIPNYGPAGKGPKLVAGMTIAIEPMASTGDHRIGIDGDGWTIRTFDGSLAAQFEHTVLVTKGEPEILTARP